MLLDDFFCCCSAESMEVLQPSATDDGRHMEESATPHAEGAQARANPVAPTMEEPSTTRPTSPGGGLHEKGDPTVEEVWDVLATSSGLAEAGTEPAGDAPSSAAQSPPVVAEQVSSTVAAMAEVALRCCVQAQLLPRRAPLPVATAEVKEIVWKLALALQLIQRDEEFEVLKEWEASTKTKKLRANLMSTIGHIEVSLMRSFLSHEESSLLIRLSSIECDEGV